MSNATIKYVGPLSEVCMNKRGISEPGDEKNIVPFGVHIIVDEAVAAKLVGEIGGGCWEYVTQPEPVKTETEV